MSDIMIGFLAAAIPLTVLFGMYLLHMKCVADDVLKEEKRKLREWAYKEAQIRVDEQVRDILSSLEVNMPVVLVNESDMNWGE